MNILFVVSECSDWTTELPGVRVVSALTYLMDPTYGECRSTKVFNLCRSTRYQSHGYYVSLLAEARNHHPLPDAQAIEDLHSDNLLPNLSEELGDLIDVSLHPSEHDVVDLDIVFGHVLNGPAQLPHTHLCMRLFELLRAPILHVRFERALGRWKACSLIAGSVCDIPAQYRASAGEAALAYLKEQKIRSCAPLDRRARIAILHDPQRTDAPSNPRALKKFMESAALLGMHAEMITPRETRRLAEFDALFIRDTTNVNHYTYQLARQAAAAGMVVIDDSGSILRCNNKIYLNELLTRHHIGAPNALVVHRGNVGQIIPTLGLPCVLKRPDGAFSVDVSKIETEAQLFAQAKAMLDQSELVLAQEYLPTDYDWRVGVLDGRALFVCKYYMAPGHWQIIKRERQQTSAGRTEALSVGEAPDEVVRVALEAARLIGDGFYGVDLKQVGAQVVVIEINDNPNVDAGNEDAVLADALYREVMGVFRRRIDALKGISTS